MYLKAVNAIPITNDGKGRHEPWFNGCLIASTLKNPTNSSFIITNIYTFVALMHLFHITTL